MSLIGNTQLAVRRAQDLILQLSIQWFTHDRLNHAKATKLSPGTTCLDIRQSTVQGATIYIDFYGKDYSGNTYYKSIGFDIETSYIYYKTQGNQSYIVSPNNKFQVRRIAQDSGIYYILNMQGVYLVLQGDSILTNVSTLSDISVYEFNVVFPTIINLQSSLVYKSLNGKNDIKQNINTLVLKDSADFQWSLSGTSVIGTTPDPVILTTPDDDRITTINGVSITTNTVGVSFSLAPAAPNNTLSLHTVPSVRVITIPGKDSGGVEAPNQLPTQLQGIGNNDVIFQGYNFSLTSPSWSAVSTVSDSGIGQDYYRQCKPNWTSYAPDGVEESFKAIADLKLKVDGNVSLLPALAANVIVDTPEYRLFNPHFVSDTVIDVVMSRIRVTGNTTDELASTDGYFRISGLRRTSREFAVFDGGTVNYNITSSGPSLVEIKREEEIHQVWIDYKSYSIGSDDSRTIYLTAELGEKDPIGTCRVRLNETSRSADNLDIDTTNPDLQYIIIGRVRREAGDVVVGQDHLGVARFDFSKKASNYEGSFAVSFERGQDGSISEIVVKSGEIRVINKQQLVSEASFSPRSGVIYIHVSRKQAEPEDPESDTEGAVITSAEIELDDTFPEDDDDNTYYKIAQIERVDGTFKIIQDHHGGTPLFLFFSSDCINSSIQEEDKEDSGDSPLT